MSDIHMNNCPWCRAAELSASKKRRSIMWHCRSFRVGKSQTQSPECRIRELEAEAAGVVELLAACEAFGIAERDYNSAAAVDPRVPTPILNRYLAKTEALGVLCREYAQAKEETDEPAS